MAGKTTRAGLGHSHQVARAAALAALINGSPCPRCGQPMYRTTEAAVRAGCLPWMGRLDLDHLVPRVMGGVNGPRLLSHARCNRAAGAHITNLIRRVRKVPRRNSRW